MTASEPSRTAAAEDAAFIYQEWDRRTRAHDIDGLLELHLPDAVLASPLIPRVLDQHSGVLTGHEQMRPFFQRGTDNHPNELVRWHRSGHYHFDGHTLIREYPRETPNGEQIDLVEVMELNGPKIAHHRIYWAWFGAPLLMRATS